MIHFRAVRKVKVIVRWTVVSRMATDGSDDIVVTGDSDDEQAAAGEGNRYTDPKDDSGDR
jgi:hypothetical protein